MSHSAFTLPDVLHLARYEPGKAIDNPDSYVWYALAAWFGDGRNRKFTFATGTAVRKTKEMGY